MRRLLSLLALLVLVGTANAAFTNYYANGYSISQRSVVRLWTFGGGNSTSTGLYVNTPTSIYVSCWGTFDSAAVAVNYSATNGSFGALSNQAVSFTAANCNGATPAAGQCSAILHASDTKTGYYAMTTTSEAGSTAVITCLMVATGAVDAE